MKFVPVSILCLISLCVSSFAQDREVTIAILDVQTEGESATRGAIVYAYILDNILNSGKYTVVERAAIQDAIRELEVGSSGLIDESTAAKIGRMSGADQILITSLLQESGTYYLTMRIVSVESAAVKGTVVKQTKRFSQIDQLAEDSVDYLLSSVSGTVTKAEQKAVSRRPSTARPIGNYASIELGAGYPFFLGVPGVLVEADWPLIAPSPAILYNLVSRWGVVGIGVSVDVTFTWVSEMSTQYTIVPVFLALRYMTPGATRVFAALTGGVGASINIFDRDEYENGALLMGAGDFEAGVFMADWLSFCVDLRTRIVMFNEPLIIVSPGISLNFSIQ